MLAICLYSSVHLGSFASLQVFLEEHVCHMLHNACVNSFVCGFVFQLNANPSHSENDSSYGSMSTVHEL